MRQDPRFPALVDRIGLNGFVHPTFAAVLN